MPDSLSLVGSILGGPIAGLPIKAGLSEFLPASHRSAYRWWVAFQCPPLIADNTDGPSQAEMHSAWSEDTRTVARRRKRSLSDKSTNVAISARRREFSFTLPGLLVHGCRARGKRCQTEEDPLSWKRISDSGDDELKRRYPPGLRLYWYDKSLHRESRRKLSLITAQAKQSQR